MHEATAGKLWPIDTPPDGGEIIGKEIWTSIGYPWSGWCRNSSWYILPLDLSSVWTQRRNFACFYFPSYDLFIFILWSNVLFSRRPPKDSYSHKFLFTFGPLFAQLISPCSGQHIWYLVWGAIWVNFTVCSVSRQSVQHLKTQTHLWNDMGKISPQIIPL